MASHQQRSKIDILRLIADDAIESHLNTLEMLRSHEGATDAYQRYCRGLVDSHFAMRGRYKLDQLRL